MQKVKTIETHARTILILNIIDIGRVVFIEMFNCWTYFRLLSWSIERLDACFNGWKYLYSFYRNFTMKLKQDWSNFFNCEIGINEWINDIPLWLHLPGYTPMPSAIDSHSLTPLSVLHSKLKLEWQPTFSTFSNFKKKKM